MLARPPVVAWLEQRQRHPEGSYFRPGQCSTMVPSLEGVPASGRAEDARSSRRMRTAKMD